MNVKRLVAGAVLVVALGIVAVAQRGGADSPVIGVWRLSEVTLTGPNARTLKNPQPGLVIFTPRYYSRNEVTSDAPRPEIPLQNPTDKQRADAFSPFTANAGTYTITGDEIRYDVITAKHPTAMKNGNVAVDTFRMEGKNTLWLTVKVGPLGSVANPATIKLTRVE